MQGKVNCCNCYTELLFDETDFTDRNLLGTRKIRCLVCGNTIHIAETNCINNVKEK